MSENHSVTFRIWIELKKKIFMGGVVDGVFLNDVAEEVLKSKDFLKVPILVGVVNHEFGWILPNVSDSDCIALCT